MKYDLLEIFFQLLTKSCANNATLLLGWPLRNIHISNDNGSFTKMFSFLLYCQEFYETWLYWWVIRLVSYIGNAYPSRAPEFTPSSLVELMLLIVLNLCCPIMCLCILSSVLWCSLRFRYKNYVPWFLFTSSCL